MSAIELKPLGRKNDLEEEEEDGNGVDEKHEIEIELEEDSSSYAPVKTIHCWKTYLPAKYTKRQAILLISLLVVAIIFISSVVLLLYVFSGFDTESETVHFDSPIGGDNFADNLYSE
jgi:hypothetical protein